MKQGNVDQFYGIVCMIVPVTRVEHQYDPIVAVICLRQLVVRLIEKLRLFQDAVLFPGEQATPAMTIYRMSRKGELEIH